MSEKLLVRSYDVGSGDCIYVRVPDGDDAFHMLIDCGSREAVGTRVEGVVGHVKSMLPEVPGTDPLERRLDLLVVTHDHDDHYKGFNPDWWEDVQIGRIWLSAFLKTDHPQAEAGHKLSALAAASARSLVGRGLTLSPAAQAVLRNSIGNAGARTALRNTLPAWNGITPLYVSRDVARKLDAAEREEHGVRYKQRTTCFEGFDEETTRIRILAPEWDIDRRYLGEAPESCGYGAPMSLRRSARLVDRIGKGSGPAQPVNVSPRDFRCLRDRLRLSAFAFGDEDGDVKNNTSVVLLLEWRGRRLLFPGDAEWERTEPEEGVRNGSWEVMIEEDKKYGHLRQPLDFLKVSHHGSANGTPFLVGEEEQPLLDPILPRGGAARASVSTGEKFSDHDVPSRALMEELGRRAGNACKYEGPNDFSQPPRTDIGSTHAEGGVGYVDVPLLHAPSWTPPD